MLNTVWMIVQGSIFLIRLGSGTQESLVQQQKANSAIDKSNEMNKERNSPDSLIKLFNSIELPSWEKLSKLYGTVCDKFLII